MNGFQCAPGTVSLVWAASFGSSASAVERPMVGGSRLGAVIEYAAGGATCCRLHAA